MITAKDLRPGLLAVFVYDKTNGTAIKDGNIEYSVNRIVNRINDVLRASTFGDHLPDIYYFSTENIFTAIRTAISTGRIAPKGVMFANANVNPMTELTVDNGGNTYGVGAWNKFFGFYSENAVHEASVEISPGVFANKTPRTKDSDRPKGVLITVGTSELYVRFSHSKEFRFINGVKTEVRVTGCDISNGRFDIASGEAVCSPKDNFSKARGRKLSLTRALSASRFSKMWRTTFWKNWFNLRGSYD